MSFDFTNQIESQFFRLRKIFDELEEIYRIDQLSKSISNQALIITHEIVEKCANILDQTTTFVFENRVYPKLVDKPKRGGYFPAAKDEQSYRSSLGQWGVIDLATIDPELEKRLRSLQPMASQENQIFLLIRELASKKHIGLEPQSRIEEKRVTVEGNGAKVVWNPANVKFGYGVRIVGTPINPTTQMPIANKNLFVKEEVWVNFVIESKGLNATLFLSDAIRATERAVETLFKL